MDGYSREQHTQGYEGVSCDEQKQRKALEDKGWWPLLRSVLKLDAASSNLLIVI